MKTLNDDERQDTTQILMNFGPVKGNVVTQNITMPSAEPSAGEGAASPERSAGQQTENADEPGNQLTIRQLVIFFEQLTNKSLSPEYTNISEFSKLIARFSGRSAESIRTKIASGIDYDNLSVKKDAQVVADLIRPFLSDLADQIEDNFR